MIILDLWPSMASVLALWNWFAPYILIPAGVIVAIVGVVYARKWLKETARERRRPPDPSPKRTMILAGSGRRPILEGKQLVPGDLVELRIAGPTGPVWVKAEVKQVEKMWCLMLPSKEFVRAVGQLARWPGTAAAMAPAKAFDRKEYELRQQWLRCQQLCDGSKDPDKCVKSCELFSLKDKFYIDPRTLGVVKRV